MYRGQLYLRRRRYRTETSSSGFIEAGIPSWGPLPKSERLRGLPDREDLRNCLKSPNRLQIEALRTGKTGQKHHFLLVTAPKLPLRLCFQLLFRQSLEEAFSETQRSPGLIGGSSAGHGRTITLIDSRLSIAR
jgi:hypothetical protein